MSRSRESLIVDGLTPFQRRATAVSGIRFILGLGCSNPKFRELLAKCAAQNPAFGNFVREVRESNLRIVK